MYSNYKNLLIRLILVGVWTLYHMCTSTIGNLNLGLTIVKFYNVWGAQVVQDPHYNQEWGLQVLLFVVHL